MTNRLNLQPSIQPLSVAGVTPALQAMTGFTGVSWSNTGREILYVSVGASATVLTLNIGSLVLGQAVTAPTVSLSASTIYCIGPFPSPYDEPSTGINAVWVDFSVVTTAQVALLQIPGVS
ncbi:MAG TPA: hypothetical protein VGG83_10765 [Trebonia sp.]|jgi:hypothetical protein